MSLFHFLRRILPGLAIALVAAACATLPGPDGRVPSSALTDTSGTRLGRELAGEVAAHPGKSGVHDLSNPRDSFAARAVLAGAAEKSLDVQYYIWNADEAGDLLFEALWTAANRGVRVWILLDDNNTRGLDSTIAALDAHPNIEVRLYNPFVPRDARMLGFAGDFARLNRRMHNKSFTADNQLRVVGGRNIGNEYFVVGGGLAFADWDVLLAGSIVPQISRAFDLYWNSASAYPASVIVGAASPDDAPALEARFSDARADPDSLAYIRDVRQTPLLEDLRQGKLSFEWTDVSLIFDDPGKTLAASEDAQRLLLSSLSRALGDAQESFDLVSPYYVPGDRGAAEFVHARQRLAGRWGSAASSARANHRRPGPRRRGVSVATQATGSRGAASKANGIVEGGDPRRACSAAVGREQHPGASRTPPCSLLDRLAFRPGGSRPARLPIATQQRCRT